MSLSRILFRIHRLDWIPYLCCSYKSFFFLVKMSWIFLLLIFLLWLLFYRSMCCFEDHGHISLHNSVKYVFKPIKDKKLVITSAMTNIQILHEC